MFVVRYVIMNYMYQMNKILINIVYKKINADKMNYIIMKLVEYYVY